LMKFVLPGQEVADGSKEGLLARGKEERPA
jgi:hypothetical protein